MHPGRVSCQMGAVIRRFARHPPAYSTCLPDGAFGQSPDSPGRLPHRPMQYVEACMKSKRLGALPHPIVAVRLR